MKMILLAAFLFVIIGLSSAATCGDDICGSGENCTTCMWDCGVCDPSSGSGGGSIGTKPEPKTVTIWDGESGFHKCPVWYSSYVYSGGKNTSVRFRVLNNFSSSTGAFRLSLSSTLSWFVPKNLTYAFGPDGYDTYGRPYWDIPGMGPNESTEVFFVVNKSVGLIDMVDITADILQRWQGGCKYFAPYSGSAQARENITSYLDFINHSQDFTIYYVNGNLILAHLARNNSFAVFEIDDGNVTPVFDSNSIHSTVAAYLNAASPKQTADTSKPYKILNYSRSLKEGPETNCMMITGMDRFNCTDRESCRYACASVPVCWYMGQVGWPFIDALLDYRKTIDKANIALDRAINSSFTFSQLPSTDNADIALFDLVSLNRAETAVAYHPLFTKYNFCPPPEYAIPRQIDAKRQLLNYQEENCVRQYEGGMFSESFAIAPKLKAAEPKPPPPNASQDACMNQTGNFTGNFTGNMTGNITCNLTANATTNVTGNITGNATGNVTGNATANMTANVTINATVNASINMTGNATSNVTANASSDQNASQANATIGKDDIDAFVSDIKAWIDKGKICSGVSVPLSALLATFVLRNQRGKGKR